LSDKRRNKNLTKENHINHLWSHSSVHSMSDICLKGTISTVI